MLACKHAARGSGPAPRPCTENPAGLLNGLKQGTAPKADQLRTTSGLEAPSGTGGFTHAPFGPGPSTPSGGVKQIQGGNSKKGVYRQMELTLDVHRQCAYTGKQMILSYRDKKTEGFASGTFVKAFQGFEDQAAKRLAILNAAPTLDTLRALPSNRLEALRGDRAGQYSIRINQQWRICFEWLEGQPGPSNVEIIDYH